MQPHRIAPRQSHYRTPSSSGIGDNGCNDNMDNESLSNSAKKRRLQTRHFGGKRFSFSGGAASSARSERSAVSSSNHRQRQNHQYGIVRGSSSRSVRSSGSSNRSIARNNYNDDNSNNSKPHVLCAIGENLARETCVVSLDLSAPFLLTVTKQSNGQSYSETIACLSVLKPHEVLMNEGRYHSPLARKVVQHFDLKNQQNRKCSEQKKKEQFEGGGAASTTSSMILEGFHNKKDHQRKHYENDDDDTIVKFISRSCFDQTRGAELLRKLARQDTYETATIVDDYIVLSSSHAILQYSQVTLGAVSFAKHSLDIRVHTGGHDHHKMEIDRSTLLQLELLSNNSNNNNNRKHSLIATMDCTKTGVGHRLLRTTLMAPPCRLDTITARLDLVDAFLHDENLFYATLQQLQNLSSLDKMLTNIVVVPSRMKVTKEQQKRKNYHSQEQQGQLYCPSSSMSTGNTTPSSAAPMAPPPASSIYSGSSCKIQAVNARIASKGISALVCIKSTLETVPILASILKQYLDRVDYENNKQKRNTPAGAPNDNGTKEPSMAIDANDEATIATAKSSLLMGLGVGRGSKGTTSNNDASSFASAVAFRDNQLLRAILFALGQPDLDIIRDEIGGAFTESTTYTRNANAMKHQECFALKSTDDNGLMDVLRKAFLRNVDDIYKKADEYAERYGISHVAVKYSTNRGYFLSLPIEMASTLPYEFIQPSKSGGRFIFCTTEEVLSLNAKAQDNVEDLLLLTHERIQQVLNVARSKYDALARLSDAVALLDLCHSFADKVTLSKLPWTRPSMTDGGKAAVTTSITNTSAAAKNSETSNSGGDAVAAPPVESSISVDPYAIAICNGRYGIEIGDGDLPSDNSPGQWIANDTYASLNKNLTIISGINGSGKSTYLKQIAIIVLLAHCGSYVPAEEALIPLTNRLCARMMTADDQESNISSFMLEMKETAFICRNATSRSLILLDELGRATSNEDGVAIAWAVAECLLAKGAMTYFVSHYPQLCQMSRIYPSVQNQHLQASISTNNEETEILYSHKIASGPCQADSNYGIDMAISCGWPSDVLKEAREIENSLKDKLVDTPLFRQDADTEKETQYIRILKETIQSIVDCVETQCEGEASLGSLCTALEAIKVSMLEKVPKAEIERLLGINSNEDNQIERV